MKKDKQNKHLIVIGASAGGISALTRLMSFFKKDLKASVLIVLHLSPTHESRLPSIIQRHTALPVSHPGEIEELLDGHVYIAPPNMHMTLVDGKIVLRHGPKINHNRPSIDALFYSAALYYGPLAIGIVLSGLLDDGSAGLAALKKCRGTTIVQEPEEATYPDMPSNALKTGFVDYVLKLDQIVPLIEDIISKQSVKTNIKTEHWDELAIESKLNNNQELDEKKLLQTISTPSALSCPDCGGVLWKLHDQSMDRYRCRVGHAYNYTGLIQYKDEKIEEYLWKALRVLQEQEDLLQEKNSGQFKEKLEKINTSKIQLRKLLDF